MALTSRTASRRRRSNRTRAQSSPSLDEPSDVSTTRLSLYLRALARCEASGRPVVASDELASASGVKPALVRKDLTQFGQFGIRGVGYEVSRLRSQIVRILGLDRDHGVVILGAGNLGMALADSSGFNTGGFQVLALFDPDGTKIGTTSRRGLPIRSPRELAGFVRRHGVEMAILAVPAAAGQKALDQAARAGIRAILNFVPGVLEAPPGVHLKSVDLKIHLEGLSSRLSRAARRSRPIKSGDAARE